MHLNHPEIIPLLSSPWKNCLPQKQSLVLKRLGNTGLENSKCSGFPCSSVVKNLPANARDTGLIPGLGGSHTPWGNYAHVPQPLNLCSRTQEPQLLKHAYSGACVPLEEKSVQ